MAKSVNNVTEGKTKMIIPNGDGPWCYIRSKDTLTALDGDKRDVIAGKAELATRTTCNVFRLLQVCGIPVAFGRQVDNVTFSAPLCDMLPVEVVVRREVYGSYLKRAPHLKKGHVFPRLKLEFFLKTSGKKWKDHELPCDDPYMVYDAEAGLINLYDPKQPDLAQNPATPFLTLREEEVFTRENEANLLKEIGTIAKKAFLILEKAWQLLGKRLVDFKVEFGISPDGKLLLADVIDNDSWRLIGESGEHLDKQLYREDGELNEVTARYRKVADLTDRFGVPRQRLIIWRGSEKDQVEQFCKTVSSIFGDLAQTSLNPIVPLVLTCSMHKEPVRGYRLLQELVQAVPDTVIIAYIGRSNGAGPTLSANTTVPVITVPAGYKDFPEDVWSSLRTPSDVPVMTVLEPANAVLAALQILGMRNPSIYAMLRLKQEERLADL